MYTTASPPTTVHVLKQSMIFKRRYSMGARQGHGRPMGTRRFTAPARRDKSIGRAVQRVKYSVRAARGASTKASTKPSALASPSPALHSSPV